MFVITNVKGANIARDISQNIKNIFGGKMGHYAKLVNDATEKALDMMLEKADAMGYEGVVGLEISNPVVADGAVEMVLYGNIYRQKQ